MVLCRVVWRPLPQRSRPGNLFSERDQETKASERPTRMCTWGCTRGCLKEVRKQASKHARMVAGSSGQEGPPYSTGAVMATEAAGQRDAPSPGRARQAVAVGGPPSGLLPRLQGLPGPPPLSRRGEFRTRLRDPAVRVPARVSLRPGHGDPGPGLLQGGPAQAAPTAASSCWGDAGPAGIKVSSQLQLREGCRDQG